MNHPRRILSLSRALAITLAFLLVRQPASFATAIYPMKFGQVEEIYGKSSEDCDFTFSHPAKRQFVPFVEEDGKTRAAETCFGSACYNKFGFSLFLFVQGERKESIPDCGGKFSIYIRPGIENTATSGAPVMLTYSLEDFPKSKPGMPMFVSVNNENSMVRSDPVRFSSEMPAYGNSHVRIPGKVPYVFFYPLSNGWALRFSFRWLDFQDRLPFSKGRYPVSWRMIVRRERSDGSAASWGTVAEPVVMSWGRPGDELLDEIQMMYFLSTDLGPSYRGVSSSLRTFWTTYRQEKWMFYLDPGIPTFEPKNPESDDLFVKSLVDPILEANDNIDKAIYYSAKANIPVPPVKSYTKAERRAIVSGLDRVLYVEEQVDDARRDYLLARLLEKPVPVKTVPSTARPKKLKKLGRNQEMTTDDLNLEDEGDALIELDDVDF